MEDKAFLGIGWSFPPVFDRHNKEVQMVVAEQDIRQSIFILLETEPGERVHRYDFGCGIRQFMFEPMTQTIQTLLRDRIEKAVMLYEPRINLLQVDLDMSHEKEGIIYIVLDYMVLKTNRRSNIVYPFYLREGTDIENK